jgi:hypothetical protein
VACYHGYRTCLATTHTALFGVVRSGWNSQQFRWDWPMWVRCPPLPLGEKTGYWQSRSKSQLAGPGGWPPLSV